MYRYIVVDEHSIVREVKEVKGEIDKPGHILVQDLDYTLLGQKYEEGKFIKIESVSLVVEDERQQEIDTILAKSNPTNKDITRLITLLLGR